MSALTEDEAKTKICPLSFSAREIRGNDGSGLREGGPWCCQASGCMAWQAEPLAYEYGEPLPFGAIPSDAGWEKNGETWYCGPGVTGEKRQRWRKPLPLRGFCGAFSGQST